MMGTYITSLPTPAPIDEALLWTKIGSIGTLIGSALSLMAIVISLSAFFYPRRIKIDASISQSFLMSTAPGIEPVLSYTITVRNVGAKAVTVKNVSLNFGGRKNKENIFIGMLNEGPILRYVTTKFPVRLEAGESFDYYLSKDKLDYSLCKIAKEPREAKLFIVVDEVIKGSRYIPTKWTLNTFIRDYSNNTCESENDQNEVEE